MKITILKYYAILFDKFSTPSITTFDFSISLGQYTFVTVKYIIKTTINIIRTILTGSIPKPTPPRNGGESSQSAIEIPSEKVTITVAQ